MDLVLQPPAASRSLCLPNRLTEATQSHLCVNRAACPSACLAMTFTRGGCFGGAKREERKGIRR